VTLGLVADALRQVGRRHVETVYNDGEGRLTAYLPDDLVIRRIVVTWTPVGYHIVDSDLVAVPRRPWRVTPQDSASRVAADDLASTVLRLRRGAATVAA
jgi:hypothetical protein